MAVTPSHPSLATPTHAGIKRESPDSDTAPPMKKQKRPYHHYHRLQKPLEPGKVSSSTVDRHLNASICHVLNEAGFDNAEPVAIDGLRANAEEYMLHLLSYVRQSMTSCRRIQPIPQDFEHGLRSTYTPVAALQPHLKPLQRAVRASPASSISPSPSSPSRSSFLAQKQRSLPTPPPDTEEPIIQPRDFSFLGDELNATEDRLQNTYIPKHFPKFPSKHTYQETPVFATKRELNPEKLREQATEEGKLGEEALRKLTRAGKDVHPGSRERQAKTLWGKDMENMDSMFDKTLKALLRRTKSAGGSIGEMKEKEKAGSSIPELGPIVNNDRMYWRKSGVGGAASGGRK